MRHAAGVINCRPFAAILGDKPCDKGWQNRTTGLYSRYELGLIGTKNNALGWPEAVP